MPPDNIGTVEMTVISKRHVISDQPSGDAPRLMLIYYQRLSDASRACVRESLRTVLEGGQSLIIDGGVEVFQLVGGKWLHLDGTIELTDVPKEPTKINFREFT